MRRPWMKRLQHAAANLGSPARRERARLSKNRQNRFARRVGLTWLTLAINLLLASMAITGAYFLMLSLVESGILDTPGRR